MSTALETALREEMARWETAGLRRQLRDESRDGLVDLCSNDYLSLTRHPEVVAAARGALEQHGAGAGAARLLGGGTADAARLERAVASWLGCEAALLFPSGYQANLGVVSALAGPGDAVFSDAHNHASLIDGARISRARVRVYAHGDLEELERLLEVTHGARRRLVLVEGVFSMDGDRSDLAAMHALCERHDAWLVVDEAHATGLLGPGGAGACAAAGIGAGARLAARVVTGGKALGVAGALVCARAETVEHLLNRARPFVFTTAPPPATVAALLAAVGLARNAEGIRSRTLDLATDLASALDLPAPGGAIVPVPLATPEAAVEAAAALRERGLDVRAVRPPTVPPGGSGLRVVLHAHNDRAQVDSLIGALAPLGAAPRLPAEARSPLAQPLFVAGTDTGVGKTVVSALLLRAARELGPARYWKPVQTGDDSDTRSVGELAEALPEELLAPAHELPLPASPHEAATEAGTAIDPEAIAAALSAHRGAHSGARLIVELAGGLLVPYTQSGYTQLDWLARERPPLVLVARSGLGTLNHTLLSLEALRAHHLEPRALALVGPPHASNRETLRRLGGVGTLVEIPWIEGLTPSALSASGIADLLRSALD